jgi:hypothetical protein
MSGDMRRQPYGDGSGADPAKAGLAKAGLATAGLVTAGLVTADTAKTAGTYLTLMVLGAAQALVGAFFYSSGPVPLAAIGFDVAIFASCLLGAWGMRRPAGALAPAAAWFLTAFALASGTHDGSVLITATTAGTWFLFGGATSAAAGLVAAFAIWSRSGRGTPRLAARRLAVPLSRKARPTDGP